MGAHGLVFYAAHEAITCVREFAGQGAVQRMPERDVPANSRLKLTARGKSVAKPLRCTRAAA